MSVLWIRKTKTRIDDLKFSTWYETNVNELGSFKLIYFGYAGILPTTTVLWFTHKALGRGFVRFDGKTLDDVKDMLWYDPFQSLPKSFIYFPGDGTKKRIRIRKAPLIE